MRTFLTIACLAALIGSAPVCHAGKFLTRYQAEQAIRHFEGSPDVRFTDADTDEDVSGPAWSQRGWFTLKETVATHKERSWQVDATSGEVLAASYGDNNPTSPTPRPFGPLTRAQCLEIAETFVRTKYADFDAMNFKLDEQDDADSWTGYGWSFSWHQEVEYGAVTPNYLKVEVNPRDGHVESYESRRFVTPKPSAPKFTVAEAVTRAKSATGIVTQDSVGETILIADPDRTYWHMTVSGVDRQGKHRCYVAEIDAQTGDLAGKCDAPLPANFMPKIMVAGEKQSIRFAKPAKPTMVSARTALAQLDYTVYWDPKKRQLRAERDQHLVIITIGSKIVVVDGKHVEMAEAPRLVKDRTQILSTLIDLLKK